MYEVDIYGSLVLFLLKILIYEEKSLYSLSLVFA